MFFMSYQEEQLNASHHYYYCYNYGQHVSTTVTVLGRKNWIVEYRILFAVSRYRTCLCNKRRSCVVIFKFESGICRAGHSLFFFQARSPLNFNPWIASSTAHFAFLTQLMIKIKIMKE